MQLRGVFEFSNLSIESSDKPVHLRWCQQPRRLPWNPFFKEWLQSWWLHTTLLRLSMFKEMKEMNLSDMIRINNELEKVGTENAQ